MSKHPLIGQRFPVLGGGFVELRDFLGGDAAIVEAARLTAQSEGREVGSDRQLLRFLMRHNHSTPTEFFEIVLYVRCPMDVWRQWIRHRTASVNEYSTRYTAAIDECLTTPPDQWRSQSKSNRQGSGGFLDKSWPDTYLLAALGDDEQPLLHGTVNPTTHALWGVFRFETPEQMQALQYEHSELRYVHKGVLETLTPGVYLSAVEGECQDTARDNYEERLVFNVAKEQARKDLPLSNYTEAYWKIDGGNLINFLRLRMDGHAQKEIRDYANIIGEQILAQVCPLLYEAFVDYVHKAMKLTRLDQIVIKNLFSHAHAFAGIADHVNAPYKISDFMQCQHDEWKPLDKCRERDECLAKLQSLGMIEMPQ